MAADVDLIPADYAKAGVARLRVKQLLIACVSIAVVVGLARLVLHWAISSEKLSIARLENQGQNSARSKAQADAYRQQKTLAEKQLAELDELRGGDRLRLLLLALDGAYTDSIWLDEMRLVRRATAGTTGALPGGGQTLILVPKPNEPAAAATPAMAEQRVELTGRAMNHSRLAEFMRRLSSQPGIADVRLLDTRHASYMNGPVIDLTLTLLVDEKARKPL